MKNIPKELLEAKAKIIEALRERKMKIEDEMVKCNECIDHVNAGIDAYNTLLAAANSLKEEVSTAIEDWTEERSEKWKNGDQSQVYDDWKEQWSEEFEEVEQMDPCPDVYLDHGDDLESMPNQPGT